MKSKEKALAVYNEQFKGICRNFEHKSTNSKHPENKNESMTNNDSGENERISQNFLGNGSTVVRQDLKETIKKNFMEALIEISSHWIRKRAMTSFCAQKVRPIAQIQKKRRM